MENWYEEYVFKLGTKKSVVNKVFSAQKNFFDFFPFEFIYRNAERSLKNGESVALSQQRLEAFLVMLIQFEGRL